METKNKINHLDKLEEKVESHIVIAIEVFQNLPKEKLLQPATDGGWSIAQCLDHLNGYGHYYLPQIQKGIEDYNGPAKSQFKSSFLGSYFTKMMDPDTGKRKAKAFKNHVPKADLEAKEVVAEFIRQQEVLLEALHKANQVDLNKINIPISIFKWIKLNLGDTFAFLIAHNERHVRQAKRNL
jgi:uncharacterized damage-inducible protein DinB